MLDPANTEERLRQTFLILAGAALGMGTLLALLPAAGHDQMWLLLASTRLLHGQPLYGPTIFETNPPTVMWLGLVPAALAPLLHLPDTALGKLLVVALEVLVAAVCRSLLGRMPGFRRTPAVEAILLFSFVSVFAVMPARDFGQRDHLLILLLLPYIVLAGVRATGVAVPARLAVPIGVAALLGLTLKPHQVLTVAAVELTLVLLGRRVRTLLRPEFLTLVVSGLLYLGAVRILAPLYFSTVIPIVKSTYWAYGLLTPAELFRAAIELHLLLLATAVLYVAVRPRTALSTVLFVAGCAATLSYYLQGTGWYYQQLPALSLLALALVSLLIERFRAHPVGVPRALAPAAAALGLLALVLTAHFMDYPFTAARAFPVDTPDPAFFAGLAPGTPVTTLSVTIDDTLQPIYKYHLTLAQRWPALLMMPAILRAESATGPGAGRIPQGRLAELEGIQHRDMVEDLKRWRPKLILVERCDLPTVHCQTLETRHDNLLAWFGRDPAFNAIFNQYREGPTRNSYTAYTLR